MAANPVIGSAEIRLEARNNRTEVRIQARGLITSSTSAALERGLRGLMPKFKRIVLDVSNVDYIDSSGMDALVRICLRAKDSECALEIVNPKPRRRDLLLRWLHSVFEGHEEFLGMTPD